MFFLLLVSFLLWPHIMVSMEAPDQCVDSHGVTYLQEGRDTEYHPFAEFITLVKAKDKDGKVVRTSLLWHLLLAHKGCDDAGPRPGQLRDACVRKYLDPDSEVFVEHRVVAYFPAAREEMAMGYQEWSDLTNRNVPRTQGLMLVQGAEPRTHLGWGTALTINGRLIPLDRNTIFQGSRFTSK